MQTLRQFQQPGEYPFVFTGKVGELEAIYTRPVTPTDSTIALLGHPHSLHGGTMHNKVVTTMARAFKEIGIPSIRFNFRGVGKSFGNYDEGIGESEDMVLLVEALTHEFPQAEFVFAGFSFGSYVTYRACAVSPHKLLISIAPAVHHYDYKEFAKPPMPWVIVQGDADEVVSYLEVKQFVTESNTPIEFIEFPQTSHFFHGKLIELKQAIIQSVLRQGIV
jgi:alpha/beta superfamily hydrolase